MSYKLVDLANTLGAEKELIALKIFKEAVAVVANKSYIRPTPSDIVNISTEFGTRWVQHFSCAKYEFVADRYAEANNAFNFANLESGAGAEFVSLAKELVPDDSRCNDSELKLIAQSLKYLLTCVTRSEVIENGRIF